MSSKQTDNFLHDVSFNSAEKVLNAVRHGNGQFIDGQLIKENRNHCHLAKYVNQAHNHYDGPINVVNGLPDAVNFPVNSKAGET